MGIVHMNKIKKHYNDTGMHKFEILPNFLILDNTIIRPENLLSRLWKSNVFWSS